MVRIALPISIFNPTNLKMKTKQDSKTKKLKTIRDLLRYSVTQFNAANLSFGHGNYSAWDEAVYLLLHTLKLPLDTLEPFLDARVLPDERSKYLEILKKRCEEKIPAAYLTGEAWLQGYSFKIDDRVIIPRSPISELIMQQLDPWIADTDQVHTALDLCTGSGCLAILTAMVFENAQIDAVDLSSDALSIATQNINEYGLENRVNAIESDLFNNLNNKKYDLIICNPPYVNQTSMDNLPTEYLHEPSMALAGGNDGMDLVHEIIAQASNHLNDNGILILEIGHEYDNFVNAFPHLEPIWLSTETTFDQIMLLNKSDLAK